MEVAFAFCALFAVGIASLGYTNWLRVLGYLPGEEQDYGAIYEYLWFGVFTSFVIGVGLILV